MKDTFKRKKTSQRLEKLYAKEIFDKELLSQLYKNLLKLNSKKIKQAKTLTDSSPHKIYRWKISIWKDAPHCMLWEKWKLKQWDSTIYLLEWPNFWTLATPNAGEDMEQGTFIHCQWECKILQPLWKTVWQFLMKLNILLLYDPAITVLGIYPKEMKTYAHTKTWTQMFIAVLFIIAKIWK